MKEIMRKQQLIGILALLLILSQVSTETKQELSSPAESDQEKSEQTTAEETSDPANDDVTDPDPLEDAKMDPEEMPDLGKEDFETEPASDDVANDAYSSLSKTVILCEHAKGKLRCPVGTTIYITAANYGRTTGRSTCPNSHIKTTNCRAISSFAKVTSSCQNKRECDLSSSNSVFGDPCVGTYKYLQVSFRCRRALIRPECRSGNYRWLNDRDRAMGHITKGNAKCDRALAAGWYRFSYSMGQDMPTKSVRIKRCQTHAPGWFRGTLPTQKYQRVSGTVCFHWNSNTCRWQTRIMVTNCGLYRVYRLVRTPQCSLRYCGNKPALIRPECRFGNYRWLNDRDRAMGHKTKGNAKCDRALAAGWYRFSYSMGQDMPTNSVRIKRCQTHAPGWFRGTLPTQKYQRVSGTVCFHWNSNTCRWQTRIMVTNCGSYRVYRLVRTPNCSLRYCGNRIRLG